MSAVNPLERLCTRHARGSLGVSRTNRNTYNERSDWLFLGRRPGNHIAASVVKTSANGALMSACLSTTITLKDVESFEEYGAKAAVLIAEHGGEVVLIGGVAKLLVGQADHHYEVVVRFPDTATIEAFYESDEYQALIPLRDKGADVVFKVIEEEL